MFLLRSCTFEIKPGLFFMDVSYRFVVAYFKRPLALYFKLWTIISRICNAPLMVNLLLTSDSILFRDFAWPGSAGLRAQQGPVPFVGRLVSRVLRRCARDQAEGSGRADQEVESFSSLSSYFF